MKVITIQQPQAIEIALGIKTIDIKSWKSDYRGILAIRTPKEELSKRLLTKIESRFGNAYYLSSLISTGSIIATVYLSNIRKLQRTDYPKTMLRKKDFDNYLKKKYYGWVFKSPRTLREPIKIPGKQKLQNVPEEIEAIIRSKI